MADFGRRTLGRIADARIRIAIGEIEIDPHLRKIIRRIRGVGRDPKSVKGDQRIRHAVVSIKPVVATHSGVGHQIAIIGNVVRARAELLITPRQIG